jgi:hypothetical protein
MDGTPEQFDEVVQAARLLHSLLSPDLYQRVERLRSGQTVIAHYTSADNAVRMIRGKQFWLRNVRCMNDYSEVQHGISLILNVFHAEESKRRDRLLELCDRIVAGAAAEAIAAFDNWKGELPGGAFIGCLSDHDPSDQLGRLSMWRAYGSGAGVAITMNTTPFVAETDELKAYSLPVLYLSDGEFSAAIDQCLDGVEGNIEALKHLDAQSVTNIVFWWLIFLSVSLKHPAFKEEQEWRVIYLPVLDRSPIIEEAVETVAGIPQLVQKIPLIDDPSVGLHEADLPNLVRSIIVGPSEFPLVIRDALISALRDADVPDPEQKVLISWIPLRG